jgi:hypothetical protein
MFLLYFIRLSLYNDGKKAIKTEGIIKKNYLSIFKVLIKGSCMK